MNKRRMLVAAVFTGLFVSHNSFADVFIKNQVVNNTGSNTGKLTLYLTNNQLLKLPFAAKKAYRIKAKSMRVAGRNFVGFADTQFETELSAKQVDKQCVQIFNQVKAGQTITLSGSIGKTGGAVRCSL